MADDRHDLSVRHSGVAHQALPTGIFIDPILKATDRNVLCVMRTQMGQDSKLVMPTYREIKRMANIGSDATVSRAISILRLTRWIVRTNIIRDEGGRIVRVVYDVCDEPEALQSVIAQDDSYLDFVSDNLTHNHPAVAHAADMAQNGINAFLDDVVAGIRSVRSMKPTEKQEIREASMTSLGQFRRGEINQMNYFYNAVSNKISILDVEESSSNVCAEVEALSAETRLQKMKSGHGGPDPGTRLQFLKSQETLTSKTEEYCSSSSFNTTTTAEAEKSKTSKSDLYWPDLLMSELNDNERGLILRRLSTVDGRDQQPLINQLTGRMMDSTQPEIEDPVKYMFWLITSHQQGQEILTSFSTRDYRQQTDKASAKSQKSALERQLREVKSKIGSLKTLMEGPNASKNPALHQQLDQSLKREESLLQALTEEMQQLAES